MFANRPTGPVDAATVELLRPLVEKAALVQSINDAWALVAALTVAALLCVPFAKPPAA
jgi:DHA2 family multidrug resistance protein